MPVESFTGTNAALLKQTIAWLTETRSDDRNIDAQRALFQHAWQAARQFEGRALPRTQLTEAMNDLVDQTQGEWKEEALWLAGEAHLRMYYFYTKYHLRWPSYGYDREAGWLAPKPEFFDRLIEQFPNSPLRPFAQWRRAECPRRQVMQGWTSSKHSINQATFNRLKSLYENVEANEGSIAWAWTQARLGKVHYYAGDIEQAAEHYRSISEQMPPGTEKVRALLDLAHCLKELEQPERAAKSAEAVMALPNVEWWGRAREHVSRLAGNIGKSKYFASRLQK